MITYEMIFEMALIARAEGSINLSSLLIAVASAVDKGMERELLLAVMPFMIDVAVMNGEYDNADSLKATYVSINDSPELFAELEGR